MVDYDLQQIYELWMEAWNEDVSVLKQITAPDCRVHQARMDGKSSDMIKGVEALETIITEGASFFDNVEMTLEVGPIINENYMAARWNFFGLYKGGMPGAKAKIGEKINFKGMDIFRVENGKIQEYWVSSDGIHLMEQLGMF